MNLKKNHLFQMSKWFFFNELIPNLVKMESLKIKG
jgi:hypothetical protein